MCWDISDNIKEFILDKPKKIHIYNLLQLKRACDGRRIVNDLFYIS